MVTKAELHARIDALPDDLHDKAARRLDELGDPVLRAVLTAPLDDEPETDAEREAVAESYAAIRAGKVISNAELAEQLDL